MAESLGYHPQVILAGRRINDGMGFFIAQKLVKMLVHQDVVVKGARVGVFGLTFKENVPDMRNSRVPDIANELESFGVIPLVHDPHANPEDARDDYGLNVVPLDALRDLDAAILAVPHAAFLRRGFDALLAGVRRGGIVIDIKSVIPRYGVSGLEVWSL
jgi:UDP-N-acetyl-D-galactosamine dehydrogenase